MIYIYITVVLLYQTMGDTGKTQLEDRKGTYIWSRYLRDKLQFGTLWKVYIPAMTYDLLHSTIHRERLSNHRPQETLLGLIGNLPSVLSDRHPCQRGSLVVYGRQFDKQFFVQHGDQSVYFMTANYRICGLYSFAYNPSYYIDDSSSGLSERNLQCPDEKPLHISWNLHALHLVPMVVQTHLSS